MSKQQTVRGLVSNLRYIEQIGRTARYTDKPGAASSVTFEVGGRAVTVVNKGFPAMSEGDDVEVTGAVNGRSGGLEAAQVHNHTSGASWQFSPWGAAKRSFFR
jgi:hypothetical protein